MLNVKNKKKIRGQAMSEYLILVLLIAVGSIAATTSMGKSVFSKISQIQDKIQNTHFTDVQGG
jgi:hypothetical protein